MTMNTIKKKRIGNNKPLRTAPYPSKDLTGKRINKLLVLKFEEYKPNCVGVRNCYYRCKCDCGNEVVVSQQELNHGRKYCGCSLDYFRKNILPKNAKEKFSLAYGESSFNALYNGYVDRCKRKNREFGLTREEFKEITSKNCFFCGIKPLQIFSKGKKHKNGHYFHNGIDRIDSLKGYIKENVLPCCEICNKAKRNLSLEEFLKWIDRLINFRKNKDDEQSRSTRNY